MGVFLSSTTKIIDRATGEIFVGQVPSYSSLCPALYRQSIARGSGPNLACAVIVKRVDAQSR
jgi:2,3,4,5-tetrahydropyridine-2-carboxylate N-succinyltransferase